MVCSAKIEPRSPPIVGYYSSIRSVADESPGRYGRPIHFFFTATKRTFWRSTNGWSCRRSARCISCIQPASVYSPNASETPASRIRNITYGNRGLVLRSTCSVHVHRCMTVDASNCLPAEREAFVACQPPAAGSVRTFQLSNIQTTRVSTGGECLTSASETVYEFSTRCSC